jgi:hypothetical protein
MSVALVLVGFGTTRLLAAADNAVALMPSASNAAATVDVKALLASPLAQKDGWQARLNGSFSQRPLAVPAYADRVALAAHLELPELSPAWQLSLIDVPNKVDLERVARDQDGVVDTIDGRLAVTTPINVVHVGLNDQRIATLWPARRQTAARLLAKGEVARGPGAYLAGALKPNPAQQITIALDLSDAFSGSSIRRAMSMGGLASLDKVEDFRALSDALATARGVTVGAKVDDAVRLNIVADFAKPIPIPADAVKPFALEMLAVAGLPAERFEGLTFEVAGNQLVARGDGSPEAVALLLGLLTPDAADASLAPVVAVAGADGAAVAAAQTPANPQAAASQEHFRAVAATLDKLAASQTMSGSATQLRASARRIQELPVLNVDEEILAWSIGVVDKLNRCVMLLTTGQQQASNAAQGIQSPTAQAWYSDDEGHTGDTAASRAAFRNAQRQRREAAQAERTRATAEVFNVISEASKDRNTIRAKMTQKYGVEF